MEERVSLLCEGHKVYKILRNHICLQFKMSTFHIFTDRQAFPLDLTALVCSRTEVAEFAQDCKELGIQYVGLCCGNSANMTRIVAKVYGKNPSAGKYSPEMEKHFIFGDKSKFLDTYTDDIRRHITGDLQ